MCLLAALEASFLFVPPLPASLFHHGSLKGAGVNDNSLGLCHQALPVLSSKALNHSWPCARPPQLDLQRLSVPYPTSPGLGGKSFAPLLNPSRTVTHPGPGLTWL